MIEQPRSLQGRLLLYGLVLIVAVWGASVVATWFDVQHELDELLDGHLAQAAALLVVQQAGEIENDEPLDAPTLHRYAPKVAFQVFHDGQLALRSANAPLTPMVDPGAGFTNGFRTVPIEGHAWRVFAARGAERDVLVYVGEEQAARNEILWAVLSGTLWPMAVALPLLALAGWWVVRRGLAPLRRLGRTLAERRPNALEPVMLGDAPSEMRPMLSSLNGLFARIGELMESERRFTADAAHELRTPIAAIRMQAQVALNEPDAANRRHALQSTIEGCDRAARLVEQLLTLSRLEARPLEAGEVVDLADVARRVVADCAQQALDKGQSIEVDADQRGPVLADALLMGVLVRNLVDNAIRYSPPAARIRLGLVRLGPVVRLTVEDSGPGVGDSDLQRLGERFFRVIGSGEAGSGLGWSIVRRIAAVHRGELRLGRSQTLGGLCVTSDWPTANATAMGTGTQVG